MVLKMVPQALHCFYAEAIICDVGHVSDAKEAGGVWTSFSCSSAPPSTTCDVEGNMMVFSPPVQEAYIISPAPLHSLPAL